MVRFLLEEPNQPFFTDKILLWSSGEYFGIEDDYFFLHFSSAKTQTPVAHISLKTLCSYQKGMTQKRLAYPLRMTRQKSLNII